MEGAVVIIIEIILVSLIGAVGWLVVTVITNSRDVAVLAARVDETDVRDELGKVHHRVNETAREVSGVSGQLKQINRILGLIQQHLMGARTDG